MPVTPRYAGTMAKLVNIRCSSCGNRAVKVPVDLEPNKFVTCGACGATHSFGTLLDNVEFRRQRDKLDDINDENTKAN